MQMSQGVYYARLFSLSLTPPRFGFGFNWIFYFNIFTFFRARVKVARVFKGLSSCTREKEGSKGGGEFWSFSGRISAFGNWLCARDSLRGLISQNASSLRRGLLLSSSFFVYFFLLFAFVFIFLACLPFFLGRRMTEHFFVEGDYVCKLCTGIGVFTDQGLFFLIFFS